MDRVQRPPFHPRARAERLGDRRSMAVACVLALSGCGTGAPVTTEVTTPAIASSQPAPAPTSSTSQDRHGGNSAAPGHDPSHPSVDEPAGTWYLLAGTRRVRLALTCGAHASACAGTLTDEQSGAQSVIDQVSWDGHGALGFREIDGGTVRWFHASVSHGVLAGRLADDVIGGTEPAAPEVYALHVTGWRAETFDRDLTPRVYDVILDGSQHARLRIDRDPSTGGAFVGRWKVYAAGGGGEQAEYDAEVSAWDGTTLGFTVRDVAWTRGFSAVVSGRALAGQWTDSTSAGNHSLVGTRAEVLSHGFSSRSAGEREAWQSHARAQLGLLALAKNPQPLASRVEVIQADVPSLKTGAALPERDDDTGQEPGAYRSSELAFDFTLPDPAHPGKTLSRRAHGWLSVPVGPAPEGGFPAVVALNGHDGSARATLTPDNEWYWYGDAFATHGFVVLSMDVGHRPVADRRGLYLGYLDGDDPANGNGPHPAIASPGLDSDWEEDGERAWDAMRANDLLRARPDVDHGRIFVAGLSMGGEVTTWAAAMDPRFAGAIPAGFSPDLQVLRWHGSHGCWQWLNGDIGEYLDTSDLHALIAPRALIVETGRLDWTYSWLASPFAADKQVLRRARAFYRDQPRRVVHYLHDDVHHFHFGGVSASPVLAPFVRAPRLIAPVSPDSPNSPSSIDWQRDPETDSLGQSLFGLLDALVPPAASTSQRLLFTSND